MPVTPKFETFIVAIQLHFPNLRVEGSVGIPKPTIVVSAEPMKKFFKHEGEIEDF